MHGLCGLSLGALAVRALCGATGTNSLQVESTVHTYDLSSNSRCVLVLYATHHDETHGILAPPFFPSKHQLQIKDNTRAYSHTEDRL